MNKYVVIRDCSAGNETVGEMWQETKIFSAEATLEEVMEWAMNGEKTGRSRGHIQLTRADNPDPQKEENDENKKRDY